MLLEKVREGPPLQGQGERAFRAVRRCLSGVFRKEESSQIDHQAEQLASELGQLSAKRSGLYHEQGPDRARRFDLRSLQPGSRRRVRQDLPLKSGKKKSRSRYIRLQKEHEGKGRTSSTQSAVELKDKKTSFDLGEIKEFASEELDLKGLTGLQLEYIQMILDLRLPNFKADADMLQKAALSDTDSSEIKAKFLTASQIANAKAALGSDFVKFPPVMNSKDRAEQKKKKKEKNLDARIYISVHPKHVAEVAEFIVFNIVHNPKKFPGVYDFYKAVGPGALRADSMVIYIETKETLEGEIARRIEEVPREEPGGVPSARAQSRRVCRIGRFGREPGNHELRKQALERRMERAAEEADEL